MATVVREVTTLCSSVHAIATSHSWQSCPNLVQHRSTTDGSFLLLLPGRAGARVQPGRAPFASQRWHPVLAAVAALPGPSGSLSALVSPRRFVQTSSSHQLPLFPFLPSFCNGIRGTPLSRKSNGIPAKFLFKH